jgi:hypothetical protein
MLSDDGNNWFKFVVVDANAILKFPFMLIILLLIMNIFLKKQQTRLQFRYARNANVNIDKYKQIFMLSR